MNQISYTSVAKEFLKSIDNSFENDEKNSNKKCYKILHKFHNETDKRKFLNHLALGTVGGVLDKNSFKRLNKLIEQRFENIYDRPSTYSPRSSIIIKALKHSFTTVELAFNENDPLLYNCFLYIFTSLLNKTNFITNEYKKYINEGKSHIINSKFINDLIDEGALIEINKSEIRKNTIIVYKNGEKQIPITHGGIVYSIIGQEIMVISKWNQLDVYIHHVLEDAPLDYGSPVYYEINISDEELTNKIQLKIKEIENFN